MYFSSVWNHYSTQLLARSLNNGSFLLLNFYIHTYFASTNSPGNWMVCFVFFSPCFLKAKLHRDCMVKIYALPPPAWSCTKIFKGPREARLLLYDTITLLHSSQEESYYYCLLLHCVNINAAGKTHVKSTQ